MTEQEKVELKKSEAAMQRFDEIDRDEIDSDEYAELLARIVYLREKRDGYTKE